MKAKRANLKKEEMGDGVEQSLHRLYLISLD